MKQPVQSDLSLDHVRGAAAVAQKGESGGAVLKTNKQTPKKSIPSDSEMGFRVDVEFLLSLVSENRFILTCS